MDSSHWENVIDQHSHPGELYSYLFTDYDIDWANRASDRGRICVFYALTLSVLGHMAAIVLRPFLEKISTEIKIASKHNTMFILFNMIYLEITF
jgi:hypothetical protein